MSNPRWSPEQTETAESLCAEVEAGLEAALYGTIISPVPFVETVPIVNTGQVATTYPVFALTQIDGAAPAPGAWSVMRHRLFQTPAAASSGWPAPMESITVQGLGQLWAPPEPTPYSGSVLVSYMAGWGPEPALVNAILRKAAAFMEHRHSDVVIAQGLDGAAPPPPAPETWTLDELNALGRFRRLSTGGTA